MSDQAQAPTIDEFTHHVASGLAALLQESRQVASMLLLKEQQNSPTARKRLLQLCDHVVSLERTVETIQKRLQDEAAVLEEMEQLEKRAIERRHALILLLDQARRGENVSQASSYLQQQQRSSRRLHSFENRISSGTSSEYPQYRDTRQSLEGRRKSLSTTTTTPKSPPVLAAASASFESWPIHFERITKDELELSIPRTMRSGISVAMLNDALSDLEQLLEQTGDSWVTEQEIRQYCSFFRYGEATARAMLLLLCNLHRVTQRPEKGGDFIYEVPILSRDVPERV